MNNKIKFVIICVILSLFCVSCVYAGGNDTSDNLYGTDSLKMAPTISINTTEVCTGQAVGISLKDSNNTPIANQSLTAQINNQNYYLTTNEEGQVKINLNLKPSTYLLNVVFKGSDNYSSTSSAFNVNVLKLGSTINPVSASVLKNKYFYAHLVDNFGNPIKNKAVSFKVNGKTYDATTDNSGKAGFKIALSPNAKYSMKISFAGTDYYKSVSKTMDLFVMASTSITIGNQKLLSKGYLRVYLKSSTLSAISKKSVVITVNNKTFTKTTNAEGIIVFAPFAGKGDLVITATFKGSSTILGSSQTKHVKGIIGKVKNPLKQKIRLVKGAPDIDVMPGKYVMANGNMKYTLLKSQYLETIKRDSFYLYLFNKMSKYVYFKTKQAPKLQHIIVREKWNVIERAINKKVVKSNRAGYWPKVISVSLSGKSYTYAQVRDIQNLKYTCGPTSSSMCTQFLKNYVCEKQLSKLSRTSPYEGSLTSNLKLGLEKCNFKCSYFYKSSYNNAINSLKKGGCALVFHTWHHYVAILDISKDGKKVLVGNPSGHYDYGSHGIPTKWLSVNFMKNKFNNYDTSGLIVKLNHNMKKSTKTKLKNSYSSFGAGWVAKNTNERIPNIGL